MRFEDIDCTLEELNEALRKDDVGQKLTTREEAIIQARLRDKWKAHREFMDRILGENWR